MRVPKYRWLVSIAATVSLTLFNVGCSSTSGYKMPGMGWMSWNGSPSTSSATDPAPPSVTYGANSSSAQEQDSTTHPNAQQKYPGTQFANAGIPAPTNPMGTSTRTDLANTPRDPSLAGVGGPSLGGPSMGGAGPAMPKAGSPNPQHGFYNTEYQGNQGASGSRNSGIASTLPPSQSPNSAFPTAQDYLNQNVGRVNNAINDAANRASNFTNQGISGLNTTAQDTYARASNRASNAINQFGQPNSNVSEKLGQISTNLQNSAQDVAQRAGNLSGQARDVANALGNSWPASGGTASWASTPAPVTGPPTTNRNPVAGLSPGENSNIQVNPYVLPSKAPAYTANATQTNPAFSPFRIWVGSPQALPSIPASSGYTPGSTGIRGATTVQPATFNGSSSVNTPPLNPLPPRTPPAIQQFGSPQNGSQQFGSPQNGSQQPAPRGGSFSPNQFEPAGNPYPQTGF